MSAAEHHSGTRRALATPALALLIVAASAARAQDPREVALAVAHDDLLQRLRAPKRLPLTDQVELLTAFTEKFADCAAHPTMLRLRCRLGGLYLQQLNGARARIEFAGARELAAADDHDLRGRALYGLAQAQELQGEPEAAQRTLTAITTELPATRYARLAQIARNRMSAQTRPTIGEPLPPLRLGSDVAGRRVSAAELAGRPILLVVWSPGHPKSMRILERLARVWQRGGMRQRQLVAYALEADRQELRRLVDERGWRFPVLAAALGFLHHDLLALQVTGIPTWFVVGADGRLLARDLSPTRLEDLLTRSRPR